MIQILLLLSTPSIIAYLFLNYHLLLEGPHKGTLIEGLQRTFRECRKTYTNFLFFFLKGYFPHTNPSQGDYYSASYVLKSKQTHTFLFGS